MGVRMLIHWHKAWVGSSPPHIVCSTLPKFTWYSCCRVLLRNVFLQQQQHLHSSYTGSTWALIRSSHAIACTYPRLGTRLNFTHETFIYRLTESLKKL